MLYLSLLDIVFFLIWYCNCLKLILQLLYLYDVLWVSEYVTAPGGTANPQFPTRPHIARSESGELSQGLLRPTTGHNHCQLPEADHPKYKKKLHERPLEKEERGRNIRPTKTEEGVPWGRKGQTRQNQDSCRTPSDGHITQPRPTAPSGQQFGWGIPRSWTRRLHVLGGT